MIGRALVSITLAASLAGGIGGQEVAPRRPRVEVVFALDTTSSMTHLLEGAKKKIWAIAGEIARAKPAPLVFAGLVAYRDKGDDFVTRVTPLTENLDKIYEVLMGYRAEGGAYDIPECVREGLHDALTKTEWSKDKDTLRIVFLVGDAPPRPEDKGVPTVDELCATAVKSGIIINTIRCGPDPETGRVWRHIAASSEGAFASIGSDGGVVAVATPFDKDLGDLSDRLGRTVLAFGSAEKKKSLEQSEEAAQRYRESEKADRAVMKGLGARHSEDDLVDAVREKRVDLEKLKTDELPEEMRKMTPAERKAHLEKKAREREEIRARIAETTKKREAFMAEELRKRGAREEDSFDAAVLKALEEQGARKGLRFEKRGSAGR